MHTSVSYCENPSRAVVRFFDEQHTIVTVRCGAVEIWLTNKVLEAAASLRHINVTATNSLECLTKGPKELLNKSFSVYAKAFLRRTYLDDKHTAVTFHIDILHGDTERSLYVAEQLEDDMYLHIARKEPWGGGDGIVSMSEVKKILVNPLSDRFHPLAPEFY